MEYMMIYYILSQQYMPTLTPETTPGIYSNLVQLVLKPCHLHVVKPPEWDPVPVCGLKT